MEHVGKDVGQDVVEVNSQTTDARFESQCPQSAWIHQNRGNLTPYLLFYVSEVALEESVLN